MASEIRRAWITGASSGIGKAFAERLAAQQRDLVLIARSRPRLDEIAAALSKEHRIDARVLEADLGDAEQLARVETAIRLDPPGLLINSAGFGTAGAFASLDIERESQLVRVNVLALVRLTHAVLPGMLERGSGSIINVSSLAGEVPSGYTATYGSSKSFVTSFTRALYEELRGSPVQVQCLLPGLTRTDWAQKAGIDTSSTPAVAISDPDDVAAASLAALSKGQAICVPGAPNRVLAFVQRAVPRRWMGRVTARATKGTLVSPP